MPKADAESTLKSIGLVVSFSGDSEGTVVGQSLAPGATANTGASITLAIKAQKDPGGQNPIMGFVGKYGCDRATMTVKASGETDGWVVVEWPSSATETTHWMLEGRFDPDKLTMTYTEGIKVNITYDEDGDIKEYVIEYDNGTGTITFANGSPTTAKWIDDIEHVADDMTFTWAS